jgi:hypothetical protein
LFETESERLSPAERLLFFTTTSIREVRVMKAVVYDEGIFHGEMPVGQG